LKTLGDAKSRASPMTKLEVKLAQELLAHWFGKRSSTAKKS
jgi:hypothetical protein